MRERSAHRFTSVVFRELWEFQDLLGLFFLPRSVILFIGIFFFLLPFFFLLGYNLGSCHVSFSFLSLLAVFSFFFFELEWKWAWVFVL